MGTHCPFSISLSTRIAGFSPQPRPLLKMFNGVMGWFCRIDRVGRESYQRSVLGDGEFEISQCCRYDFSSVPTRTPLSASGNNEIFGVRLSFVRHWFVGCDHRRRSIQPPISPPNKNTDISIRRKWKGFVFGSRLPGSDLLWWWYLMWYNEAYFFPQTKGFGSERDFLVWCCWQQTWSILLAS